MNSEHSHLVIDQSQVEVALSSPILKLSPGSLKSTSQAGLRKSKEANFSKIGAKIIERKKDYSAPLLHYRFSLPLVSTR